MFKLKKENVVWWPIVISQPADEGKVDEFECDVQYEILPQDEYDELSAKGDTALLMRVVRNWRGLGDDKGENLTTDDDSKKAMFAFGFVRTSFLKGYWSCCSGAPAKN